MAASYWPCSNTQHGHSRSWTSSQKGEQQQRTQDGDINLAHAQLFKMYRNEEADKVMHMQRIECTCVKKWESIPSRLDCCVKKIKSEKKETHFQYISPKKQGDTYI